MRVGVPKEIKVRENRVGLTPSSVRELVHHGHQVVVEHDAGHGIGAADGDYQREGATIAAMAVDVYGGCDMIVKVKEPQPSERKLLRPGQILFTYLHLAPDREQTNDLVASNAVCIGYETVTSPSGGLPLLAPMSEVAGRLAVQAGAHYLEEPNGGKGMLLGGVPGVAAGSVAVIGGGVVGTHAIEIALGMGARVTVLDRSVEALSRLWAHYGAPLSTVFATAEAIERHVATADLVSGAVLIPGASAPKSVTRAMIAKMQAGSVVVDVAIDQGGCFETSRATTHEAPTYVVDGVVHYCVANMPGAVPRTSTYALNNATLPFVLEIADKGWKRALADDPHLRNGLNVALGRITYRAVAEALEMRQRYASPESVIGA
ncbi:MAG TPA: alanine dehydrogenase [Casimicrobiaceae bacterium]